MIQPTETQILRYILIKKGIITEEEWEENRKELCKILTNIANKNNAEVEKFVNDFLNNF